MSAGTFISPERKPLFGHHDVGSKQHVRAVIASCVAVGLLGGFSTAIGLAVFGTGGKSFSFAFWGVWIVVILMTLTAMPLAGIVFTIARMVLTRVRCNFGFAYSCLGLLTGIVVINTACPPKEQLPLLLAEASILGIGAGLVYWLVALGGRKASENFPENTDTGSIVVEADETLDSISLTSA